MIPLPCQRARCLLVLPAGSTRPSLLLSASLLHLRNSSLRPDFLEGRHDRLEHADECLRLRQCIGFGSATNGREFSATADILDVVVSATSGTLGIAVSTYCNEGCKVSRLLRLLLLVEFLFGTPLVLGIVARPLALVCI